MTHLYELSGASTTVAGDWWGLALIALSGSCTRAPDGIVGLVRAGPAVPPISLPELWSGPERMNPAVIVTDPFRRQLEESGLTGLAFRPVRKEHIVRLPWEQWVVDTVPPPAWVRANRGREYFRDLPHDSEAAEAMGTLWEVALEVHAEAPTSHSLTAWDGTDWFVARRPEGPGGFPFVSAKAMVWLRATVPRWVGFLSMRDAGAPKPTPEAARQSRARAEWEAFLRAHEAWFWRTDPAAARLAARNWDLSRVDLAGRNLAYASLPGAVLDGANLRGTSLYQVDLDRRILTGRVPRGGVPGRGGPGSRGPGGSLPAECPRAWCAPAPRRSARR